MSEHHGEGMPHSTVASGGGGGQRKEIYTYDAPWTIFGMAWSRRLDPSCQFRLAIGSYVEQYSNAIEIVKKNQDSYQYMHQDEHHKRDYGYEDGQVYKACKIDHPYPCTKLLWSPDRSQGSKDLLASTGDYLRLWSVTDDGKGMGTLEHKKEVLLDNNKNCEYCAPLTSFDWNETDPTMVGTSSIDTTCTIWDVQAQTPKTQLIAHEKEVFDIAFAQGVHVFASVGADGSVRMFDLRSLEHSTIIYESPGFAPLLRLAWNKEDHHYLATFMVESHQTIILDIRYPSAPIAQLTGHSGCVNAICWAPHSGAHICTAGDDSQALIWDITQIPKSIEDPILAYNAGGEINNLQWSASTPDWISIAFGNKLQILRV